MKYKQLTSIFPLFFCGYLFMLACTSPQEKQSIESTTSPSIKPVDCIQRITAQDDSLANIRNHACETKPIAESIRNYTDALKQLDYSGCPTRFTKSVELHRFAWIQMIPLVEKFPDLRGEMHDVFDQIQMTKDSVAFNSLLKNIWDTWVLVETEFIEQ